MFTNVQIFPAISQGHLIQWTLKNNTPGSPITIYRRSRDSEWIKLGTVRDTYFFVDSGFDPKEGFDVVYKLVYGTSEDYIVSSFLGALPAKDRAYIKAIRRREVLAQNKGGGRPGFLLKKRDTKEGCQEYYRPVEYGMLSVNPQLDTTKSTSPVGTYSSKKEVTRGLVYPLLDEGDVWVEKFTDRRFFITGKTELTYRGIPIIYTSIALSLVPAEHPVYNISVS